MTVYKIDSNVTGLKVAEEASLGTLGGSPVWYTREPNSYDDFGGTNETVERDPINDTRQNLRGTVTGIDVKSGWEEDLTLTNSIREAQAFVCADLLEKADTQSVGSAAVTITGVLDDTTEDNYTAASGLDVFKDGDLILASGFTNSANNGLKLVSSAAAGSIGVTDTEATGNSLVAETPPSTARLECCGYQFDSGYLGITVSGSTYTLALDAATPFDFNDLDLNVGEWIYIGDSRDAAYYFGSNSPGFARIVSISSGGGQIIFDRPTFTPATDAGAGKTIRIFFGKFARNALTGADVVMRSFHQERSLGHDDNQTANDIQSQVLKGMVANTLEITCNQKSKATIKYGYVGTAESFYTGDEGLLSASGTTVGTLGEAALNTSSDVHAQRMYVHGASSPLFAYVTDLSFSIDNGATPATAVGVLGAFDVTLGNFKVSGKATAYFATVAGPEAVRANSDVSFDTIFYARNKGIVIDLPMVGLGGGSLTVDKNEPIKVDLDAMAAKCDEGYTFGMTFFPYLP